MFLTSDGATNYSHQDSIVLAQRQKYRSMEQNRSPEIPMDTLSLTKEAKIYNEEKTVSLTIVAGKTGHFLTPSNAKK